MKISSKNVVKVTMESMLPCAVCIKGVGNNSILGKQTERG